MKNYIFVYQDKPFEGVEITYSITVSANNPEDAQTDALEILWERFGIVRQPQPMG